jgi:transposase InsO family protein
VLLTPFLSLSVVMNYAHASLPYSGATRISRNLLGRWVPCRCHTFLDRRIRGFARRCGGNPQIDQGSRVTRHWPEFSRPRSAHTPQRAESRTPSHDGPLETPAERPLRRGGFAAAAARGLKLRYDHGSQYMSDHFQKEIAFLGIESSPAFVRAPEGNGCAERFIRTLKENLLWIRTFDTIEDLRQALLAFRGTYNTTWLIERHGFMSPEAFRQMQLQPIAKAA